MTDGSVEATLKEIRDQARAAAGGPPNLTAPRGGHGPEHVAATPSSRSRGLRRLVPAPVRPAAAWVWHRFTRSVAYSLEPLLRTFARTMGDMRVTIAAQERRLQDTEQELVRLRQKVFLLDEASLLADRSRRGTLRHLEELEARVAQIAGPPSSADHE